MALTGVALETSFARFMASMAAFNNERPPSRRRWEFVSMVESGGSYEKTRGVRAVKKLPSPDGDRRPSYRATCPAQKAAR
jgi:hypothetical protein